VRTGPVATAPGTDLMTAEMSAAAFPKKQDKSIGLEYYVGAFAS